MHSPRRLIVLLQLLVLAACGEDQSPTTPTRDPGGPESSHTPGHKVVNSLADPGNGVCNATQCTMREAINDPGSTEISFAPGLTGTITLAQSGLGGGTLTIDKQLSITGPNTGIIIRRRSTDPGFRIFRVDSGVDVTLTNLTIQNGKTDHPGGAILNRGGTLRLTNCTVVSSSAPDGGGIANQGTLTLLHSRVAGNRGGGIFNRRGTLTLTHSTVEGNTGPGISQRGGTLTLTRSTVARNAGVGVSSGGVFQGRAVVTLANARVVGNTGGGITNSNSIITITNSTIAGNSALEGGGLANFNDGIVTIANSTIAGNSATSAGGGIFNQARVRHNAFVGITSSTVSGNSAPLGGGIFNSNRGEFTVSLGLSNSTVVHNSATMGGGGIWHGSGEIIFGLTNSLVALNSAPAGPDVLRTDEPVDARFSLIGDGSGSGITNTDGNQVGNASEPIDPKLGPLANNGGPTRTHALLLGSPAIDAASTSACPTTDQRGVLRPQGTACDIGSYERE